MQSVYKPLKIYFLASFLGYSFGLLQYAIDNQVFAIITLAIVCVFDIVKLQSIFRMRKISNKLKNAFICYIASILGIIITIVIAIVSIFNQVVILALLSMITTFIFSVIGLMAEYYFVWGLDEIAVLRNYDYPKGKIRLIFFISLISGIIVSSVLASNALIPAIVIGAICSIIYLWILYDYLQAAGKSENIIQ